MVPTMGNDKYWYGSEGQVDTEDNVELEEPKLYQVLLLNDDYTPMDFVVWILQNIFYKSKEVATRLMLDVHQKDRGLCGVFTYDVARTKVYQVKLEAQKASHPLECIMERE